MISCHPEHIVFYVRSTAAGDAAHAWPSDGQYAVYNDAPVRLTVTNTDAYQSVVFHTRTNVPGQFTVKHREGLLAPGESATVLVSLRKRLTRLEPAARFLVQCAVNNMVPSAEVHPEDDAETTSSSERNRGTADARRERDLEIMRRRFQLGKAWRGRNLDLDGSASVIVPCDVKHQPPWVASLLNEHSQLITAIRALRSELGGLEVEFRAISDDVETHAAELDKTRAEHQVGETSVVAATQRAKAATQRSQSYSAMEALVLLLLTAWTVFMTLHL